MYLYKLEAKGKGFPDAFVIVLAEDEEGAFQAADQLLQRNALGLIEVSEIAIVEKKRAEKANGYVLER
ncbi:DUF3906 family protein [Tumebacillus flagellatus]|uniref:DUF3906 domain-containing protein n=1 Tax=Tumebacillus flagellatus TaxID=1157490 RepID=A0A074MDM7_9BACL|nr:DUF3906 family protein [Tumebacillus flagellatus]KEO83947.1 hypothetical protein EL26_07090 [Tumebacillus flagellatus]